MNMPRNSSNFATAAKILFDSAQKVGAVGKVGRNASKKFQRINKVNDKRSLKGSLYSVSVKVTKYLEARGISKDEALKLPEFVEKEKAQLPSTLHSPQHRISSEPQKVIQLKSHHSDLHLTIPSFSDAENLIIPRIIKHTTSPSGPCERSETFQNISDEPKKLVPESIAKAFEKKSIKGPTEHPLLETELITEDKPIFEYQELKQQLSQSQLKVSSRGLPSIDSRGAERSSSTTVRSLVDHSEKLRSSSELEQSETGVQESLTVDTWEQQREKELERLDAIRKAEDEKRAVRLLEEQHKTLGLEWVKKRSRTVLPINTASAIELKEIYQLKGEESYRKLESMVTKGSSESSIAAAVAIIMHNLSKDGLIERMEAKKRLLDILQQRKELSRTFQRVKLHLSSKDEFLDLFRSLEKSIQESLDFRIKKKAIKHLMSTGLWEEAVSLVNSQRCSTSQKRSLIMTLLFSSLKLEVDVKASILLAMRSSEYAGKEAKLLLALLEKGSARKAILKQSVASSEADEKTFSALIACSSEKDINEILTDMEKKGYNGEDLCVKRVLLLQKFRRDSLSAVFEEIDKQKQALGLRPFHLSAAVKATKKDDSGYSLSMTVKLLKEFDPERSFWALKKILPKLYDRKMFEEIVSLCDHYSLSLPLEKILPVGVAFFNEALISVGRSPLNALKPSDINYTRTVVENAPNGDTMENTDFDISASTEIMLSLARERQWEKALQMIQRLPPVNNENSAALTLLFNCALSAAVDKCEVTQEIYTLMKKKTIVPNTTTINTALSSFSKASLTNEALQFVKEVPVSVKDINTYMILLSLLAKNNMYEEVITTFDEAKKVASKLPTSLFAIVLGIAVNHSWENSLRIFQDLIKMHGKNANEALKIQVFKCLEKNGRHAEMAKLMKSLDSKRKKR